MKKQLIYGDSTVNSQNREHRTALPFRPRPPGLRQRLLVASLVGSGLPEGWQGINLLQIKLSPQPGARPRGDQPPPRRRPRAQWRSPELPGGPVPTSLADQMMGRMPLA